MKAPAGDPGDCCIAQRAESTLFIPEIAKSAGTPKRFQHVSPFPCFEVGFKSWIVRVGFAFNLDVPFDGSAGLIVGLVPALHASRSDPQMGLQQSSRGTAGGYQFARGTLVVSEVALALVLLVSAGLLLRSLERLVAIDPGFAGSHLLTMQVQESGHRFDHDKARDRFFTQALEAVRQVPGVTSAAFTSQLPLSGDFESYGVQFELKPDDNGEAAFRYAVRAILRPCTFRCSAAACSTSGTAAVRRWPS